MRSREVAQGLAALAVGALLCIPVFVSPSPSLTQSISTAIGFTLITLGLVFTSL